MRPDDPEVEQRDEPEENGAPGPDAGPGTDPEPDVEVDDPAGPESESEPEPASAHGLTVLAPDDFDGPEPDVEFDPDADDETRTVLITGASGNIGRKLRAAWEDAYDLVLLDRDAGPHDPEVIPADLSTWDESWVAEFDGVDTVVHLAANPDEFSSWEALEGPNLDMLSNVLLASALAGVERVIFASSNHVMGGYRELGDMPITEDLPPRPGNPYGATKLMGERFGKSLSQAFDLTFIALRLGWVQPGENRPDTLPDAWSRSIWLSDDDLVRLFDAAVEADLGDETFVVVNGLSNNRGTRWDLSLAGEVLEYDPEDDAEAVDEDDLDD